jgi:outer membrane lipoprotein-sorting protein
MRLVPLLAAALLPLSAAENLESVLARMDKAAPGFRGMTAQIRKLAFTAVVNDTNEEFGSIALLRPKSKDLRMLVEFTRPDPRSVTFAGRKLQIFYPKINTVQEYDLGKQAALVDQFLLLGFGSSGSDLKQSYSIQYLGEESLSGQKTAHLELVPKSTEAQKHVRKIEIWIADSNSQPQQQKVWQNARDYTLVNYSDVKLVPNLKEEAVQLKLPAGVKKEYPQK